MSTTSRKHGVFGRETRHGGAAGHRQHEPATQRTDAPVPPERIQARAYEIYEARTREGSPGDAMSDWLQAERELNGGAPGPAETHELEVEARVVRERRLANA